MAPEIYEEQYDEKVDVYRCVGGRGRGAVFLLEKKPGINVTLVLGLLLLPGRNENLIVPMLGIPVEMS